MKEYAGKAGIITNAVALCFHTSSASPWIARTTRVQAGITGNEIVPRKDMQDPHNSIGLIQGTFDVVEAIGKGAEAGVRLAARLLRRSRAGSL
jgi:hypothetical protein